ncbi:MAG: hypothetical protein ABWK05_03720 [Pyrobaculum sp.]
MYAFADLPFSPSGVTHLVRLHRAVGFEKEVQQLLEVLKVVKTSNNNVLAVVVAPYGWGKSELLDELENIAVEEGFDVVRTALSLERDFVIDVSTKKQDKPMLVLIDEADEISRIVAAHKLGALSDEKFMSLLQKTATYIRALLEPRSYAHILGNPERFNKIAIVVALTPQLYYTILKNVIPDVFDLTTGRVFREVVIDTRYPFWQFVETVKQRLRAYSTPERIRKLDTGDLDPLSPFTLAELAALYNLARKKGEVTPRSLMKYAARLLQYKAEGRRLADLLREEGIDLNADDELLELAFSGMPHDIDKLRKASREVYLYKVSFEDKEAQSVVREYLALRGYDIDPRDPKTASYEPYLYYTVVEEGKLYLYLISEEELELPLVGRRYIVSEDVAKLVISSELQTASAIAKEYGERLENPVYLYEEIEQVLGVSGVKLRICCGHVVWANNMGFREGYIFLHVDREDELKKAAEALSDIVAQGAVGGYVVDYVHVFITSRLLLTETIYNALAPLLSAYWKRFYTEPAQNFVTLQIYGADKFEKLKLELIKYVVDKILKKGEKPPAFVDELRLAREKLRENVLKYTLALRRGKERKIVALIKAADALHEGREVEGLKSYKAVEEILLKTFDEYIHEKELRSLIQTLFPVNLWREIREEDAVELLKLLGVLVPVGEVLYTYREDLAERRLLEIVQQLEAVGEVVVERHTPLGTVKVVKKVGQHQVRPTFRDRDSYAKALRELLLKLVELREAYDKLRKEAEAEAEEKAKLLRRAAAVLEKFPQRRQFIDVEALDEEVLKKEESLAQKAEEALRIWNEVRDVAQKLGSALDVEKDVKVLLNLTEPWVEDYLGHLKLYVVELNKKYQQLLEQEKASMAAKEWLRARLKIEEDDLNKALSAAVLKTGVEARLLKAVASRGVGAVLDVEELSRETGLDKGSVERGLEQLYRIGAIEKRYVS